MSLKPKLLLLLNNQEGGTGTYARSLLPLLHSLPISLHPLLLYPPHHSSPLFPLLSTSPSSDKYSPTFSTLTTFLRHHRYLTQYLHRLQPHIVFSIGTLANFHSALLSARFSFLHIASHHTAITPTLRAKLPLLHHFLQPLISHLYSHTQHHLTVSQGIKQELIHTFHLPPHRLTTIYNGISLPSQILPHHPHSPLRLLTIARFSQQKDHSTLLKALHLLHQKHFPFHLTLIGSGPTKPTLLKLAHRLALTPHLTFLSPQSHLSSFYRQADIFILPTLYEGLPYTLLEALAHSLPVIASNVPFGPAEILGHNQYGLLVPPRSPSALAQAIHKLSQPSIYSHYHRHAYQRARFFSLSKMFSQYKKFFLQIIHEI